MNKTKKATHNSKNYNRKRGQKVEVKGVFEHYIDDTKIILKFLNTILMILRLS